MVQTYKLAALRRQLTGKKVKQLRAKGQLPAVLYGHGTEATSVLIDDKEFRQIFRQAGTSALVDLVIDEAKPIKVLIHEPQVSPLNGAPIHVDFYAVKMDEKIETAIPVNFVGVSPAVEEQEGNLVVNKHELMIRCLPGDLISEVEVDLSALKNFDDQIRVEDLQLPSTIEVMHESEEVIVLVAAPISQEELDAELSENKTAEEAAVEELGKEEETKTAETPIEPENSDTTS